MRRDGDRIVTIVSQRVRVSRRIGLFRCCKWSGWRRRELLFVRRVRSELHHVGLEEILLLQGWKSEGLLERRNLRGTFAGGLGGGCERFEEAEGELVELPAFGDEHDDRAHHDAEEDDRVDGALYDRAVG